MSMEKIIIEVLSQKRVEVGGVITEKDGGEGMARMGGLRQGWEFTHSLIAHSLICSFFSNQMSDCERFPQIAQDK